MTTINQTGVSPDGMVYVSGPKETRSLIADGAVTPGVPVVRGGNEEDVSEAGDVASAVVGIALENDWREVDPADTSSGDTPFLSDFSDGDDVEVAIQPGIVFNGVLANGENVNKGDLLVPAANGELKAYDSADTTDQKIQAAKFKAEADIDASASATRGRVQWLGT